MANYPIWNDVANCSYKTSKSYGNKDTGEVNIYVGSSTSNSHLFVNHITTKRKGTYKGEDVIFFKFSVDDVILKISIFECRKNGNAGKHIKTISKLNKIKSLKI